MEQIIRLKKGEFWKGTCPKGGSLEITCSEGALWLTQEGDSWDYCLGVGKSYSTELADKLVVESLEKETSFILKGRSPRFHFAEQGCHKQGF